VLFRDLNAHLVTVFRILSGCVTCSTAIILISRDVSSAGVMFHGYCIPLVRRHHRIIPFYIRNALMLVFHIISLPTAILMIHVSTDWQSFHWYSENLISQRYEEEINEIRMRSCRISIIQSFLLNMYHCPPAHTHTHERTRYHTTVGIIVNVPINCIFFSVQTDEKSLWWTDQFKASAHMYWRIDDWPF
jgi:hypothetical protein